MATNATIIVLLRNIFSILLSHVIYLLLKISITQETEIELK